MKLSQIFLEWVQADDREKIWHEILLLTNHTFLESRNFCQ